MNALLAKYAAKLAASGLTEPGGALLAALDDELAWSHAGDPRQQLLEQVFAGLNCSALLLARPAGAYQAVMAELAARALNDGTRTITPGDCETRTFLHDIPVVDGLDAAGIVQALRQRKGCVVIQDGVTHVAALGTVSPEQTFVTMSSLCFACFVAFFSQHLRDLRLGNMTAARRAAFARIKALLPPDRADLPDLAAGPFASEDEARAAIIIAGARTVEYGLVDSYFGNISYRLGDTIHISQTGSSLDELGPCIDPCRMDGTSCAGLTASSELTAHQAVYEGSPPDRPIRAILHGHPRFSVILSLDCDKLDCPLLGECHRACTTPRAIVDDGSGGADSPSGLDIPIVPGEVGTGPFGLCNTLPPAIRGRRGAIVYGHGLFTLGTDDFREAFRSLLEVEHFCRLEYFRRVAKLGG